MGFSLEFQEKKDGEKYALDLSLFDKNTVSVKVKNFTNHNLTS